MKENIEIVVNKWMLCDITGDQAMSNIKDIIHEEDGDNYEIINACVKEKR